MCVYLVLLLDEEVDRDKTGEADEMNLEVDFKDDRGDAYLNEQSVIFKEEMVGGRERVTLEVTDRGSTRSGGQLPEFC